MSRYRLPLLIAGGLLSVALTSAEAEAEARGRGQGAAPRRGAQNGNGASGRNGSATEGQNQAAPPHPSIGRGYRQPPLPPQPVAPYPTYPQIRPQISSALPPPPPPTPDPTLLAPVVPRTVVSQSSPPPAPAPVLAASQPAASEPAASEPAASEPIAQPTTAQLRSTVAQDLYEQTCTATWDCYQHYQSSSNYSDAYRDMHKLLQQVKAVANRVQSQSPAAQGKSWLVTNLQEAELQLEIVQAQTANWDRDATSPLPEGEADLQTQLDQISEALGKLMVACEVAPQNFAALDDEPATVIKPRR